MRISDHSITITRHDKRRVQRLLRRHNLNTQYDQFNKPSFFGSGIHPNLAIEHLFEPD
jgi:hypothetical protein